MLEKGQEIPDVSLKDQDGNLVRLLDYVGNPLVVYFYPKDNTPVCSAQACGFRDSYEEFKEAGVEVIGISRDSISSHKKVSQKQNLPFILLSDINGEAIKQFKVPSKFFGLLSGRVTYIIDRNGKIAHTFRSDFNAKDHVKEALKTLKVV